MTGLPEVVPPASVKVLSAPTSKVPEFAIEPPVSLATEPSAVKVAEVPISSVWVPLVEPPRLKAATETAPSRVTV